MNKIYIGAYLEIQTKKIKKSVSKWCCVNGHSDHKHLQNTYCGKCGNTLHDYSMLKYDYPSSIDLLPASIGEQESFYWGNRVHIPYITINEEGIYFIMGTSRLPHGEWCVFGIERCRYEFKDLPTSKEEQALKDEFTSNYTGLIQALQGSHYVIRNEVKVGIIYLEDTKYG